MFFVHAHYHYGHDQKIQLQRWLQMFYAATQRHSTPTGKCDSSMQQRPGLNKSQMHTTTEVQ